MRFGAAFVSHFFNRIGSGGDAPQTAGVHGLSLRSKGILALIGVMLYAGLVVVVVAFQRDRILNTVVEQQQLMQVAAALASANTALAYMHLHIDETEVSGNPRVRSGHLARDIANVKRPLRGLENVYPRLWQRMGQMEKEIATLHATGKPASVDDLRDARTGLIADLDRIEHDVNTRSYALSDSFAREYDLIALIPLIMGLVGGVAFAAIVLSFFSHLVRDIRTLQARAMLVAGGYRGPPLEVARRDELGSLMEAVNRVQAELREREQRLELAQERRFHHEKMAAVGSLASAIAHEINNPIAAITGIARGMTEGKETRSCPGTEAGYCRPDLILEHTKRIAAISLQLAEHTAPHPLEPELLDLNALIRNTCSFISYDSRFRGIELALDLDHDLPAVHAVADHLTQVLMNLLINAADALGGVGGRKPAIRVATRVVDGEVLIIVTDNGHGMEAAVLSQIFKESFTTKPPDIGRGLGLFLCKALIEENHGRIELQSTPGAGTTARVSLPLRQQTVA
jgi:two-component system, NtrC family, sensor kinase